MTNTDDPLASPAPTPPPSYIRRHPILAGFAVLSGLSLFAALWPASAIVITLAVAGHATGLDRRAWSLAEHVAARVSATLRDRSSPPTPSAPTPEPAAPPLPTPRREAHAPAAATVRTRRHPSAKTPAANRPAPATPPRASKPRVGAGIDGPGV